MTKKDTLYFTISDQKAVKILRHFLKIAASYKA